MRFFRSSRGSISRRRRGFAVVGVVSTPHSASWRTALLVAAAGFAGSVIARGAEAPVELAELVVEGRGENFLGRARSGSEGAVARAELDARPFLRTGEIVELVPGMVVTQHSGTGKANQYFLRGFNLDHGTDFATDLEGMPLNSRSHGHGQGYLDLNSIMPELVRRLEYRKGPSDVSSGDFATAGHARIHLYEELPRGFVTIGVGQDDFARFAAGDSVRTPAGVFLGAIEAQRYDGPWTLPEDLEKLNAVLRFTRERDGRRLSITALAYDAQWSSTDQIPQRAVEAGALDRLGTIDPTDGGESSRFSLLASWKRTDDSLAASLYAADYRMKMYSNFTYMLDDPVNGDQFEQADRRRVYGGRLESRWEQALGGFEVRQLAGVEARIDDIPSVGLYRTQARQRRAIVREDDVLESSVGAYWEGTVNLSDRWRASAGVRGDFFHFDVESDLAANSGADDDAIVSPKLALVFRATDSVELYANLGFGFHSNDARGAAITIDPATGDPAERVDALARSTGAELGARWALGERFTSSLALWSLDLDSELIYVGDAGTTEAGRPSRRGGAEWSMHYRPWRWLTLDADVSLTRARFRDDDPAGDRIPGSLETVVAGGAALDLPGGWLGVVRLRHFGPRPLVEDGSVRSPSTSLVDARVGWGGEKLRLYADVLNVFDSADHDITYYYASRLAGEPAEGVDDVHFHPVEPRTLRVYAEWKF